MIKNRIIKKVKKSAFPAAKIAFLGLMPFLAFYVLYLDRIYPGVLIAGMEVGGKTVIETASSLQNTKTPAEITIETGVDTVKIPVQIIGLKYDIGGSADKAYRMGRSGNVLFDISQISTSLINKTNYGLDLTLDEEELTKHILALSVKVGTEPVYPSVKIDGQNITIEKGKAGIDIDRTKLRAAIGKKLAYLDNSPVTISTTIIDPSLTDQKAEEVKKKAESLLGKKIVVKFEEKEVSANSADLISFMSPYGGIDEENISIFIEKVSKEIEREPQNASFVFEGGVVKEFAPAKDGIKLTTATFRDQIAQTLEVLLSSDEKEIVLDPSVEKQAPKVATEEVNNLGIRELIGRGASRFAGSIPTRVFNINHASKKLNGILIEPGQVFSFNEALGDISAYTGYKQAYVIMDGRTVLGDGGGVCQVSTTVFRAALNAGLPIVERNAHAYRVSYYEQDIGVGYDATIYSPTTDLKFKNDTGHHILLQTHVDLKNYSLNFELYGTSDGRKATISKAAVGSITAPPPDLYIDDPTLPAGTIKQIDFKAWGAKASFNYKVEKDGQTIIEKTFYSNYRPWQAKFLRGTRI